MKIQIRFVDGGIRNEEAKDGLRIMELLKENQTTIKVSFDLIDCRIALYPDGTYQIWGGLVNHPNILEK